MLELQFTGGVFPGSSCLYDIDRSTYDEMHGSGGDGRVSTTTFFLLEDERRIIYGPLHLHEQDIW